MEKGNTTGMQCGKQHRPTAIDGFKQIPLGTFHESPRHSVRRLSMMNSDLLRTYVKQKFM